MADSNRRPGDGSEQTPGEFGTHLPNREPRTGAMAIEGSAEMLDLLLSACPDHVHLYDTNGRYLYANPAAAQAFGWGPEQMVGRSWRELGLPAETMEGIDRRRLFVQETGQSARGEATLATLQGEREYEYLLAPVLGEGGVVQAVVASLRDITERKRAEDAATQLATTLESCQCAIARVSIQGTICSWNQGAELLSGCAPTEVAAKPLSVLVHRNRIDELDALFRKALQGEQIRQHEMVWVRKDGTPVAVSLSMSPIRGTRAEIVGVSMEAHDIGCRRWGERGNIGENEESGTRRPARADLPRQANGELQGQIAERKWAEESSEQRVRLEAVVSRMSTRLLCGGAISEAVGDCLAEIGAQCGANLVCILQLGDDGVALDDSYAWCGCGTIPGESQLQGLSTAAIPWLAAKLRAGKAVHIPDLPQMPPEARSERAILERLDITSALVLPLRVAGEFAGLMALCNLLETREWPASQVPMLQLCADIIGHALERKRSA